MRGKAAWLGALLPSAELPASGSKGSRGFPRVSACRLPCVWIGAEHRVRRVRVKARSPARARKKNAMIDRANPDNGCRGAPMRLDRGRAQGGGRLHRRAFKNHRGSETDVAAELLPPSAGQRNRAQADGRSEDARPGFRSWKVSRGDRGSCEGDDRESRDREITRQVGVLLFSSSAHVARRSRTCSSLAVLAILPSLAIDACGALCFSRPHEAPHSRPRCFALRRMHPDN